MTTRSGPEVAYPTWVRTDSERRLHDDFRAFLWLLWKHLDLPAPTKLQYDMALYLAKGPKRRMIQAFRGCGKSWITAAYVLWRLYRDPQERIMVVSANEDRAIQFNTFVRRLIEEVEQLRFLRPRTRDSVLAFDVGPAKASQAPSVRAVGINGQLTGGRATLIVSDDVEVPKNSLTETMRERLAEAIKEYDAVIVPGGEIVYLGTPQTEQSIYRLVRERGYDCRIWPARYPTADKRPMYTGALAPLIADALDKDPALEGTTTEPTRFTDLDLAEREVSYGRSGFALQFMLDTSLSDAERYPLKLSDLVMLDVDDKTAPIQVVWTSDPRNALQDVPNVGFAGDRLFRPMHLAEKREGYRGRLMVIDPSGRGKDETAWVVLYALEGMLYLRAWGGFRDGASDDTMEGLAHKAQQFGVNHILIESNFGDGMFQQLFEPVLSRIYPCTTEENRVTGQKELRIIEDLEPVLNQHRLAVDVSAAKEDVQFAASDETSQRYSLLYQLTHITKDRNSLRHDDRLDALSQGVRWFRKALGQDAKSVEAAHRERARQAHLAEFRSKWKLPQKNRPGSRGFRKPGSRR